MRRTGTRVRGRRFAALLATAAVMVGVATPEAFAVDSIRDQEWHLDAMHAPEMWQTTTGVGITVAVVDTGVKADHPDLVGQVLPGKDFMGSGGTNDTEGHGTRMASMIAATGKGLDGKGAVGLAPGAKILPLKVNADGTNASEVLHQVDQAIIYGSDQGAKIINVSIAYAAGFLNNSDLKDLKAAVDHAYSKGAIVFAGAGNSAQTGNPVMYPAAMAGVVAVAAVDRNVKNSDESEHGPQIVLAAPGVDIYAACTTPPSNYCKAHGTSDATALTSASAALIWAAHPTWTNNQVLRVLINTAGKADDGAKHNEYLGFGVVRPRIALTNPGDPGPADVNPLTELAVNPPAPSGAPASGQPSAPGQPTADPSQPAASAPAKSGSGMTLWLIVGGAVLGLLVLVLVIVLVMKNRNNAGPAPVGPMPGGYPGQVPGQPPYGGVPGGYPGQQPPGGYPPPPPHGQVPPTGGNPYAQ